MALVGAFLLAIVFAYLITEIVSRKYHERQALLLIQKYRDSLRDTSEEVNEDWWQTGEKPYGDPW